MTTISSIHKTPEGEQAVMALYDAVLADWPVSYQSRTIATHHGDTYVIAAGAETAPPLILLHGAGSNSAIWRADFPAYSRDHCVFAMDLPGEPGKTAPNRPPWEGPAFAEWLEDVLDGLRLPQAALLNISQGAWTALRFTTLHPERVSRLILLCPGGVAPDRPSFLMRVIPLSLAGAWGTRRIIRLLAADAPMTPEAELFVALILKHFRSRMGVLPLFADGGAGPPHHAHAADHGRPRRHARCRQDRRSPAPVAAAVYRGHPTGGGARAAGHPGTGPAFTGAGSRETHDHLSR